MKQQLYLLIAIFISLFSFGQTLDQSSESSSGIDSGANAANPQGQSFTAGVTGNLSQISLRLGDTGAFTPGDFQLTIYNGNGYAGAVLNTTTLNINSTSSGLTEEFAIVLSSPVSITAGNMYTFDFRGLGSASINFRLNSANYGPGGYYFGSGNTGLYNTYDIWFKTFVSPPASPATHLNFDGVNDRVDLGSSLSSEIDALNTITIEAYVRPTTLNGNGVVFGNYAYPTDNGQAQLLIRRDGANYNFFLNDGSLKVVTAINAAQLNTWTHIAGVWDGTDIKIYIDGTLAGTTNGVTGANLVTLTNSFVIGFSFAGSPDEAFRGDIDEVRVWNTVRTESEINSAKSCELQGNELGLIRYYKFNQGDDGSNNSTVTTLTDSSSSANNGTLIDFALTGTSSNWLAGSPVVSGSIVPSNPGVTTPVVYNQGDTASTLTATIGTNGTGLLWYTSATGGTSSTTAPTPSTATAGSTSYWVSSTNANGCESERVEIVITVNAVTPATHLNFDGVNDRVELANESNFDFTTSFSIEAWVRVTSFTEEWQTVISKGEQGPRIHRFGSTNLIAFGTGPGDDLASTVSVNDGNWHHIAVTCNNGFKSLYVDGVLQGTQTVSTPLATNNDNVRIGSQIDSYIPVRAFHGDIDDVRFWNVARSNVEINNSKDCELNGSETGLVAYYNFNQGNDGSNNSTETILLDTSSNGNNGTLNNFTLNGATSNWLAGSPVTTGNTCATLSNNDFNINDDNILTVYPNPSNGIFSITSQEESLVTVYDTIGKKVLSTKVSIGSSNLDLSNYANGIYLLTVTNQNGGLKTFKIIKQ